MDTEDKQQLDMQQQKQQFSTKEQSLVDKPDVQVLARVPPNGGLKAWLCVVGGFCCLFCSFGFINAIGIFQLYYETEIIPDYSASTISWIATVQLFLMFFLGPIVGKLVDVVGPRKLIAPASFLAILGVCMLSLCKRYWQIMLAQGLCYGIGASALFLPPLVVVGQWFSTKRGLAVGIVASGSSLGGVILPIVVSRLIQERGFPAAIRWTALLMGILLAIAIPCVSAPFPPKGDNGQKSSGSLGSLKSLPWVLFSLGCFFIMWGLFAPFNYLPLAISIQNPSSNLSTYIISIINATSLPGRILPGLLSDRLGQLNIMTGVGIFSGISIIAIWLPISLYNNNEAGIIVFGLLYGFLSGGFVSLMTPCVVILSDGKVDELGARLGAFMLVIAFGALSGLPIEGAILQSGSGFKGLIIFSGTVMLVGGVLVTAARVSKGGLNLKKL